MPQLPRWAWWAVLVVAALVVVMMLARDRIVAALTRSPTAAKLGVSNAPSTPETQQRLVWLADRAAEVLAVLRARYPKLAVTSGYRSDAVNAAVDGSPTSRHRLGLAFDLGDGRASYEDVARYLRSQASRLSVAPRSVLAELVPPHLHLDYSDPLGKLDKPANVTTSWRRELPGRQRGEQRRFEALA